MYATVAPPAPRGSAITNTEFEIRGFNHLALVARDMAETVRWYEDSLDGGHNADCDPATDDGDVFVRSIYFKDPKRHDARVRVLDQDVRP